MLINVYINIIINLIIFNKRMIDTLITITNAASNTIYKQFKVITTK